MTTLVLFLFLAISFIFSVCFPGDQVAQRVLQHPRGHAGDPTGLRGRQHAHKFSSIKSGVADPSLARIRIRIQIKGHKEVTKQQESMFFLLFLLDDRRIRIRIS
jgi:hypothetical protein